VTPAGRLPLVMLGPLKSGLAWPSGDVTVSLGSVGLFRRGCGLDLPIAVAILTAAGTLPADPATGAPVGRGAAGPGRARIRRPPLRVPDHRATIAAVTGDGAGLQPGEAALAHGGVLCLDDAAKFERAVLRTLAQPLHDGEIVIARGGAIARFPARFILVTGMRPCPCGASGCTCTPLQTRRYRNRVTGPLGAWIPLRTAVDRPGLTPIPGGQPGQDTDALSAARVADARDRMGHRLTGTPWRRNGDIPRHELARAHPPAADGQAVIDHAIDLGLTGNLGARHITAVAWTLTDPAGRSRPGAAECAQALALWTGAAR
jgi:magnesium chelatase family protein